MPTMSERTFAYDVFLSHNAQDPSRMLLLRISPAALASGWAALERSTIRNN